MGPAWAMAWDGTGFSLSCRVAKSGDLVYVLSAGTGMGGMILDGMVPESSTTSLLTQSTVVVPVWSGLSAQCPLG